MVGVRLTVGLQFKNSKQFQRAFKTYAAEKGFDYYYTKNENDKIGALCKVERYSFYIYCATVGRDRKRVNESDIEEEGVENEDQNLKLNE